MHAPDDEQTAPWLRLQTAAYTLALSSLNYSTFKTLPRLHSLWDATLGGAENARQDIAGQDNDEQEKHHAWIEIKT